MTELSDKTKQMICEIYQREHCSEGFNVCVIHMLGTILDRLNEPEEKGDD